tara:strand:- start:404 stop:724 length:321 start_codon:yes stop_codon:yes gene_type:complete
MSESGFDRREEGFEGKVHADGEQKFRLEMRRDKLFARWAAAKLGKDGDAIAAYEKEVVRADLKEPGDQDVLGKVHLDLQAAGIEISSEELQAELERCLNQVTAEDE